MYKHDLRKCATTYTTTRLLHGRIQLVNIKITPTVLILELITF